MTKKTLLLLTLVLAGATIRTEAATVPDAPTSVLAAPGNTLITVTFTAPVSNGGDPVSAYTAVASPGNITVTRASSPLTLTGLTNGTAYTIRVFATNSVGNSVLSSPSDTVTPGIPVPPTLSYGASTFVDTLGVATTHVAVVTGKLTGCAVYPNLPIGMRLIDTTCTITGTPRFATLASNYSIVASNGSSATTVVLNLTVVAGMTAIRARSWTLTPEFPKSARRVTLRVVDTWGRTVLERGLTQTEIASGHAAWNGRAADGNRAPRGVYGLEVTVEGASGRTVLTQKTMN